MSSLSEEPSRNPDWNYHPALPIPVSPILSWPPRPIAWLRWIAGNWLAIGAVSLEFLFAWAIYSWLQPDAAAMKTLHWTWAGQIWLRNLALLVLVAGGLHLWFYTFTAQGRRFKFDARDLARNNGIYTFRNQVLDNMLWSLASGVTVWTLFEIGYFWAAANGYAPGLRFAENPVWFAVWFVLIPIWSSFHFYWIHRALHWAAALPSRPFPAPPQHQYRPLDGYLDAPGRACAVLLLRVDSLPRTVAPGACAVPLLHGRPESCLLPFGVRRNCAR